MAAVAITNLTKTYDGRTPALDAVSLEVAAEELMVMLGPSGCGKTTVLRCIAGLEEPTSGEILIDGVVVNDLPPKDRDVAMVFQNYALYPHLSVWENIAFPLRMRREAKPDIARRVSEAAAVLGLSPLLDRRPAQLSGGERQRVALGRAIVRQPKAFLLDEPLSNLDAQLRVAMRAELVALHRRLRATMIYVTHDQTEAMTMGQRIAVLDRGALQQVGTPAEVYARPANLFVATFIGTPGMNVVNGAAFARPAAGSVGFRPEDGRLGRREGARWSAIVGLVEPLGSETLVHGKLDSGETVVCRVREGEIPAVGSAVGIHVAAEKLHRFDVTGRRLP